MKRSGPPGARLVCVFLLGCVLFSFPLIAVFNVRATLLGIPVLYAYLFAAWALVIVLVALTMERRD